MLIVHWFTPISKDCLSFKTFEFGANFGPRWFSLGFEFKTIYGKFCKKMNNPSKKSVVIFWLSWRNNELIWKLLTCITLQKDNKFLCTYSFALIEFMLMSVVLRRDRVSSTTASSFTMWWNNFQRRISIFCDYFYQFSHYELNM